MTTTTGVQTAARPGVRPPSTTTKVALVFAGFLLAALGAPHDCLQAASAPPVRRSAPPPARVDTPPPVRSHAPASVPRIQPRHAPTPPPGSHTIRVLGPGRATHHPPEKHTRFEHAPKDLTFYFPSDPERRYRWVKISPTMARNLVNSRTVLLPVGTTIIVAGTQPYFPGVPAGRNTLRVSNPRECNAQVDVRLGSANANLSVAPHSTGSLWLPDGTYQVFFEFSDRPGRRFQGDDVSLHGNTTAEIQLVSVTTGNYGLREIN